MRHVNDGELHAYLDGALDLLPDGRGEEIRAHLSACSVCSERLKEEELVRERAQKLLSAAAPAPVDLPSFEELRAQADARVVNEARLAKPMVGKTHNRAPLPGLPLAWAATLILALGVGWMGGEMWRTLPEASAPAPGGVDTASIRRGTPPAAVPGAERAETQSGLEAEARSNPPATRVTSVPAAGSIPEASRSKVGEVAAEAEEPALRAARPRTQQASAELERTTTAPQVAGAFPGRTRLADSLRDVLTLEELTIRGQSAPTARGEDRVMESAAPSPSPQVSSLTVPGLKFLSAQFEEWVPGERALHIRQLLSVGDTLELRYLGMLMGADPGAEPETRAVGAGSLMDRPLSPAVLAASLPPGWNQVEMRWGSQGWLVARAPLSEDAIRGLVRTIR